MHNRSNILQPNQRQTHPRAHPGLRNLLGVPHPKRHLPHQILIHDLALPSHLQPPQQFLLPVPPPIPPKTRPPQTHRAVDRQTTNLQHHAAHRLPKHLRPRPINARQNQNPLNLPARLQIRIPRHRPQQRTPPRHHRQKPDRQWFGLRPCAFF